MLFSAKRSALALRLQRESSLLLGGCGAAMRAVFVTGGGGFVGSQLCRELARRGYSVTAYDLRYLNEEEVPELRHVVGDIRDLRALTKALRESGADVVFHVASYGMSGREQLNKKLIEEVNIGGTRNVLDACVDVGVRAVVYTSTFNVVFGGQEIREGREDTLPYFPLHKHVDHYSRTKSMAEQEVLAANGLQLGRNGREEEEKEKEEEEEGEGGKEKGRSRKRRRLRTCALRCAGIYGEGETRHLPRIVTNLERGLFQFTYGSRDSLVEFLHSDNFVQAHIKAAEAMAEDDSPVPGEAYFISDGAPINNFEFFRPLAEGLGYSYPKRQLPLILIYYMAFMIEVIHAIIGRYVYNFQPLLTRAEVFKTGVTHYFSLDKARAHFGYSPEPRDLSGVVWWFRERGRGKRPRARTTGQRWTGLWPWLLAIGCAIMVLFVLLSDTS